jgi:diguanylate cyclase (GGDEF)-like protein/PAS domain S-box-containing protein
VGSLRLRILLGPLVTVATVVGIAIVNRYVMPVANPGAIFYLAVVFAAYIGGTTAGLVSAAITFGYAVLHFSAPGHLLQVRPEDWNRIIWLSATLPAIVVLVGLLKERAVNALRKEQAARTVVEGQNRELRALKAALDQVDYGVVLLDREQRSQFINRKFRDIWRLPDIVADAKPPFVALMYHGRDTGAYAVSKADLEAYVSERVRHVRIGDPRPVDIKLSNRDSLRFKCSVLPDGGRMLSYVYITDLVEQAEELEGYRLLADNAGDVVVKLGLDGTRKYVSPAIQQVLGWTPDELLGARPHQLLDAEGGAALEKLIGEMRHGLESANLVARARHKDGGEIWAEANLKLVRDPQTLAPKEIVAIIRDISARKAAEEALQVDNDQLRGLATTDSLTELPNRRSFDTALEREYRRAERAGQPISVVMIDIDNFKAYNDAYGHQQGDTCLRRVAQTIQNAFRRPGDLAARYGGEEFAVILPDTDELGAMYVAEKLKRLVFNLALEHRRNDAGMVTISLGVACAEGPEKIDAAALVGRADQALYAAKGNGRNKVICWTETGEHWNRVA